MKKGEKKEVNQRPEKGPEKIVEAPLAQTRPQAPVKRRIVIETDGNTAQLIEANVAGNFELVAVLEAIADVVKKS